MKPRIRFKYRKWECFDENDSGYGESPAKAYWAYIIAGFRRVGVIGAES